ncbi:MAG: hypothetical protein ACE5F5_07055 [Acidimicrobiia bacterium]
MKRDRPEIPPGYGVSAAGALLEWEQVEAIAWSRFPEDVTRFTFSAESP